MLQQNTTVNANATLIYNYHRLSSTLPPPAPDTSNPYDALFTLCSLDTRVATYAAELYHKGIAPLLIFSGGVGTLTAGRFTASEAEVFASIARGLGVPDSAILIEPRAGNTGENVKFTHALLQELGLLEKIKRFVLVQKPYMERRTWATFVKQWPGGDFTSRENGVEFTVTSPPLTWEEYPDDENPREHVINIMVGDLVRIREYAAKGFQVAQKIPEEVWAAAERLIAAGYDKHLPT
ncbi:DUF218 domain-containing protein [Mycena maculata]|uniref:DUF218 domain-containing protein n=1 Tax=Mycena maculata TaxID=230809 RepID=A0AAD7N6Q2_9AGAR|nr:DUF218 domain-containing protein [Mycena maculata]